MARFRRFNAVVLCAASLTAQTAEAQTVSPPSREEVTPVTAPLPQPPSEAHVDERSAFAAGPCPLATSTVNVSIKQVKFFAPGGGDLAPEIARLLNGITTTDASQSIRVVCDLRDQANARLHQARYVATVQVPAQRIDDGVLRFEVITGHITQIRLRGEAGPFQDLVRQRIEKLILLDPLNAGDAEKQLVTTNDTPGLSVKLGLSPNLSGKPGDLVGELTVSYRRATTIVSVQNYNSKLLGRETVYARTEVYGLLTNNDVAFIAGATTPDFKKQKILQVGESFGLWSSGDRLSLSGTIAYSRPALDAIDLRTLSLIGNIEFEHPLARTVRTRLAIAGGFEYAMQRTRVYGGGGSTALNRDRIATFYTRLDGQARQFQLDGRLKWNLDGSLALRKGFNILGATRVGQFVDGYGPSRFNGNADAFVVRGRLAGSYAFGPVFEFATTLQGQYANKALLNYDQFAIGNLTIGRGYDPGANSGDRAIAGAHELRANFPAGQRSSGQLYVFYDWVHLWNLDKNSTERSRQLASVGGGVRFTYRGSIRADLTFAHPLDPPLLTGANIRRSPNRVMFSLTAQLFPFGTNR